MHGCAVSGWPYVLVYCFAFPPSPNPWLLFRQEDFRELLSRNSDRFYGSLPNNSEKNKFSVWLMLLELQFSLHLSRMSLSNSSPEAIKLWRNGFLKFVWSWYRKWQFATSIQIVDIGYSWCRFCLESTGNGTTDTYPPQYVPHVIYVMNFLYFRTFDWIHDFILFTAPR